MSIRAPPDLEQVQTSRDRQHEHRMLLRLRYLADPHLYSPSRSPGPRQQLGEKRARFDVRERPTGGRRRNAAEVEDPRGRRAPGAPTQDRWSRPAELRFGTAIGVDRRAQPNHLAAIRQLRRPRPGTSSPQRTDAQRRIFRADQRLPPRRPRHRPTSVPARGCAGGTIRRGQPPVDEPVERPRSPSGGGGGERRTRCGPRRDAPLAVGFRTAR